jgi:membrane-bound lytic murein transglycosylase D
MRVDNVVDERMDPFAASDGAARLLRANYNELGSWPLAITAYNHGAGGMKRAIRKLGTDDIGVVVARYESRSFGFASRNFYTEFLAALDVDRNAEHFFGPLHPNEPVVYETVTLDHFLPAEAVERALGVEESVLREHNRSLRPSVWNGAKYMPKGYQLRVPARLVTQPLAGVLASIPAPQRFAKQHRDRFYKVRRGDTLSKIARRHHIKERDLVALNNLRSRHRIRAGQILTLPDEPGARAPTAVATASPPADGIYRVRRGDTISAIASRFGTSESSLISLNGLRNRNQIAIGQRLVVSASTAASRADKPAATKPKEPTLVASTAPAKDSTETGAAPHEANAGGSRVIELARVMPETATEKTAKAEPSGPSPALADAKLAEAASEPPRPVQTAALQTPAPIEPTTELQTASDAPLLAETPPVGSTTVIPAPDPSDYAVTSSGRITVQAAETLGHFAEWLEIPTSRLRRLNGMRYGTPLAIGRQAKLDFSVVSAEVFEHRRLDYHQSIQEEFFDAFEVVGTDVHLLRPGDTLWYLAEKRYLVPVWLLRQYNPSLDFGALQSGARLTIPQIAPRPS